VNHRKALVGACFCFTIIITVEAKLGSAQEIVGKRQFSDQLVISEPFVEDELEFPVISHILRPRHGDEPRARETRIGAELKKRLTSDFEVSLGGGFTELSPDETPTVTGFDNLEVGLKYQFLREPSREAVASIALSWEVGGTGRAASGAESFDTLSPAILGGKGFGDLPDLLAAFRPLVLAGRLGADIPTRASSRTADGGEVRHPNSLAWGAVVEYSLPYLQAYVKDLGLPLPLNRMVPLAELDLHTALDRGESGRTTGTMNLGAVWIGHWVQIGIETVVPVNERSGKNVGIRAFVRFDLDRVLGERAGRPLFGQEK
jgi:hypothetical protein